MPRSKTHFWLLIAGAFVLLFLGLQGLFTGKVYFRNSQAAENNGWVSREEMPGSYWTGVIVYLASSLLALKCLAFWYVSVR